jgi:hypothetical protein
MSKKTTHTRIRKHQYDKLAQISEETGLPIIWILTAALKESFKVWERNGFGVPTADSDAPASETAD